MACATVVRGAPGPRGNDRQVSHEPESVDQSFQPLPATHEAPAMSAYARPRSAAPYEPYYSAAELHLIELMITSGDVEPSRGVSDELQAGPVYEYPATPGFIAQDRSEDAGKPGCIFQPSLATLSSNDRSHE
jgi:hypothetical protein